MPTLTAEQKARKATNDKARRLRNKEGQKKVTAGINAEVSKLKFKKRKAINSPLASVAKVLKGHGGKRKDAGREKAEDNKSKDAFIVVSFRGSKGHKEKASRLGAKALRDWLDSQPMPRK